MIFEKFRQKTSVFRENKKYMFVSTLTRSKVDRQGARGGGGLYEEKVSRDCVKLPTTEEKFCEMHRKTRRGDLHSSGGRGRARTAPYQRSGQPRGGHGKIHLSN
jgi:hypothetical protein